MTGRLLHPLPEGMELLGIGRSKIYELIAEGKLKVVKIGRRTLIPHDELERFVNDLTEVGVK